MAENFDEARDKILMGLSVKPIMSDTELRIRRIMKRHHLVAYMLRINARPYTQGDHFAAWACFRMVQLYRT